MPHIYARQFADEFGHYAANAMVATDFDSLTGQWAAQGTNLYLLHRLHTRADRPVDEVLEEYYSAFGPAAEQVERYFDYWEEYTMSDRGRFDRAQQEAGVSRYRNFAAFAHALYPQELFEPAEAILAEAAEAAAGDDLSAASARSGDRTSSHRGHRSSGSPWCRCADRPRRRCPDTGSRGRRCGLTPT